MKNNLFHINLIYSRVQASSREVDIKDVLAHGLAPIPASMFRETGEIRCSKTKSVLKNQLKVEVASRNALKTDITVIDGSALLWVIYWHVGGTITTYVSNFRQHIERKLHKEMYIWCSIGTTNTAQKVSQ